MNDDIVDVLPIDAHQIGTRPRPWQSRLWRGGVLTGLLVGLVLLLAACGTGSASPGVASVGSTTTTTIGSIVNAGGQSNLQQAYQSQLAYSQCMRTHGEPSYPDPILTTHSLSISIKNLDPNAPRFISASTACKKLVPNGGPPSQAQIQAAVSAALKNAACMRTHGVPNFPDPNVSNGGISIKLGGPGIDPNSPQFQAAQKACQKSAPIGLGG